MSIEESTIKLSNTTKDIAIELCNVAHNYDIEVKNRAALYFHKWSVNVGQRVFLYGDSGSGKSTLLNLLAGILVPHQGSIRLFGNDIGGMSNSARDRFRAKNIGIVFQQFNLIPYLSVAKNIELAVYLAKSQKRQPTKDLTSLLCALKLPSTIVNTPVSNLSVGQQQRVAIMRAFINSPQLLLIDEPTSALDNSAKDAFMTHLLDMCDTHNTTMVFVSHDLGLKRFFSSHTPISSLCHMSPYKEDG